MAETKTKFTGASVPDHIASRAKGQQGADCKALMAMMKKITKKSPKMWGPSIVGYDMYRYTYDSGHSGEAPLVAFAIRGRDLVVYLSVGGASQQALLKRLGKHSMGKSCLYFRQLADLDQAALEQLIEGSMAEIRARHG